MGGKPLFPPVDPQTHRRRQDKGSDPHDLLTVNGRVRIRRKHFHTRHEGTTTPVDKLLDAAEATVSVGVREMCSRVNSEAGSFARAAANLERTAQLRISREGLRQIVENDGKLALRLSESGGLVPAWKAKDCLGPDGKSLIYLSSDGFTAPLVTQAEKEKRRKQVLAKRRRCGKKRRGVKGRGGPGILGQIGARRIPMTATGLDFYHLGENVHKARRVVFGEVNPAGNQWGGGLLHTAKHEGYGPLWERLLESRK